VNYVSRSGHAGAGSRLLPAGADGFPGGAVPMSSCVPVNYVSRSGHAESPLLPAGADGFSGADGGVRTV